MSELNSNIRNDFFSIVNNITNIGVQCHTARIIEHALANLSDINKSIKSLPTLSGPKAQSGIVISAGPSVHKKNSIKRILDSSYKGTLIATDGTYIACLKAALIPDYVLTLDPHPTRMVRWFGDPLFEENSKNDDYFSRQDLNIEFQKKSIQENHKNIELVNTYGHLTKAIVSTSVPRNVVERIKEAKFDTYWWNPLVDNPNYPHSTTRKLYNMNKLPCINTGGTVGTASWIFANSILKLPIIALVGMDFGYYSETSFTKTQTYYELITHVGTEEGIEKYFTEFTFPLTGEKFYADPTYFWYRKNFLELYQKAAGKTFNCTEGGTLFHKDMECLSLDQFLKID